jgi:phage terminase large subunit
MKVSKVFKENLKGVRLRMRTMVNQGGASSSKTYSILQLLVLIAQFRKYKTVISVVGQSVPHLKKGAIRDMEDILEKHQIPYRSKETPMQFEIGKTTIEFFSADKVVKAKGPKRHILFCNEIDGIDQRVFDQLSLRTKETVFMDYNPTAEFWLHESGILEAEDTYFIKSTYLDNPFLSLVEIKEIEKLKKYPNKWKVYGLGELGELEDQIYTNWIEGEFDQSLPYGFGLDFGFANSKDSLIKVAIDEKSERIYCSEKIYATGLSVKQLKDEMLKHCNRNELIVADSADQRMISELKVLFNMKAAKKPAGSVQEGIKLIQGYTIVVDPESTNLKKEIRNYVWSDKRGEIPVKAFDDLLDAMRYYVTAHQSTRARTKLA